MNTPYKTRTQHVPVLETGQNKKEGNALFFVYLGEEKTRSSEHQVR